MRIPGFDFLVTKFAFTCCNLCRYNQVLSDADLRKKYDQKGKAGLGDHSAVDASAFFAVLFGSDQMEGLVGRLQLATLAMAGADLKREEAAQLQERWGSARWNQVDP
jgi:DnaJ-class molecular chaperone